jgi:hypothetical protein
MFNICIIFLISLNFLIDAKEIKVLKLSISSHFF